MDAVRAMIPALVLCALMIVTGTAVIGSHHVTHSLPEETSDRSPHPLEVTNTQPIRPNPVNSSDGHIFGEVTIPVAASPWGAVFDPVNGFIYVVSEVPNCIFCPTTINIINPSTNSVQIIPMSFEPLDVRYIVCNTLTGLILIGTYQGVYELDGLSWAGFFPTPAPYQVSAFNPDNGLTYGWDDGTDANLTVVNDSAVVAQVRLPGSFSTGAVYDSSLRQVYATSYSGPSCLKNFWSCYQIQNNVSVVNSTTQGVVSTNLTLQLPSQMIYVPSAHEIFAASYAGNLTIFDDRTNRVTKILPLANAVAGLAYDPLDGNVYASNSFAGGTNVPGDSVSVVNASTGQLVGSIPVQTEPTGIAYDNTTNELFVADGATDNVTVIEFSPVYNVTFTETGLPNGTHWGVSLTSRNGTSFSTTGGALTLTDPNGTFPYRVSPVPGFVASSWIGTVQVDGGGVSVSIQFAQYTYSVQVAEAGLPPDTNWSASIAWLVEYSTSRTITFPEPNGSFTLMVNPVPGYTASPQGGEVYVVGAPLMRTVEFQLTLYQVAVLENGLPAGTNWSLTIGGRSYWSDLSWMVLNESIGIYDFTIPSVAGWAAAPFAGTLTVRETGTILNVTFSKQTPSGPTLLGMTGSLAYVVVIDIALAVLLDALVVAFLWTGRRRRQPIRQDKRRSQRGPTERDC